MARPAGTDPHHAPVPPGWPGDDPTVPEDLAPLVPRRRIRPSPPSAPAGGRNGARRTGHPIPPPDEPGDAAPAGRGDPVEGGWPAARGGGHDGRAGGGLDDGSRPGRPHDIHDRGARDDRGVDDRRHTHDRDVDDHRHDDHARRDHHHAAFDDLVAGVQPAGRVLVVMVAALLLAMLVNADALVERAERAPGGPGRDRSLAIWHPVQDVSHVLQLHRVRQLADRLAGDDGDEPAAPAVSAPDSRRGPGRAGDAAGAAGEPAAEDGPGGASAAVPRTPTAAEPLRLWVGGDSMAQVFGQSLVAASGATGVVDATLHYEMASGLARPDYYDWPAALAADVEQDDPEVVVVVFGVNDGQGIVLADGTPVPEMTDPRWAEEYGRRVGALMDQLRADGRMVVWVGQPPMREPGYAARQAVIGQVQAAEAAARPWVTLVDSAGVLGDPAGAYAAVLPDAAGRPVEVREDDGIHLTTAGGDLLAAEVLAVVGARVDLSGDASPGD